MQKKILKSGVLVIVISLCSFTFFQFEKNQVLLDMLMSVLNQAHYSPLKINDEFSGFFTFQVNHEVGEFCLLQSAMELDRKDKEIYKQMLQKIIDQNNE